MRKMMIKGIIKTLSREVKSTNTISRRTTSPSLPSLSSFESASASLSGSDFALLLFLITFREIVSSGI